MSQLRVGVLGASGETGGSITNALIDANKFSIVALARPSSISKPVYQQFQQRGVELREIELPGAAEGLVEALSGLDVVISAISAWSLQLQIDLADAAKRAGVKRFVPCSFMTVMPPGGRALLRDEKEKVFNHIKKIYLPYTVIDVGYWYQISLPSLESRKIDGSLAFPTAFYGSGNLKSVITDLRDVGKYVAMIIDDERTLNKYVLAYNIEVTQNEVFNKLEELSGEKADRKIVTEEQMFENQKRATEEYEAKPAEMSRMIKKFSSDYSLSMHYYGDNQPEYAKYLGYLTSKELYPDYEYIPLERYIQEVLAGTAAAVYSDNAAISG